MSVAPPDVRPRRRRMPLWLAGIFTVGATVLVLSAGLEIWGRFQRWPPFVCPGDALGIVLERDGHVPEDAVLRGTNKAWAVRVFGVNDEAAQDRIVEDARREIRQRGPHGFKQLEIEFWSGDPPPAGGNPSTETPRAGSECVRAVKVP